jgi:branched-chain amino acid transport system substrate-binding protein
MMMKRVYLLLIVSILLAGSILAGGCSTKTTETTPIKIGALMSQTGMLTEIGGWEKDGAMLALEQAGSQVAGRQVQLLIEDDASTDVPGSVDKTKKLVEGDKVSVLFTPLFTPIQLAVFPYLDEMKVPNLSMMQTMWASHDFQYNFSAVSTQATLAYPLGIYAYEELGYRTMTLLAEDSIAAKNFALSTAQAFKSKGGQVIQEQYFPLNAIEYAPFISNLKQADVFLYFAPGIGSMRLIPQYRQFGLKMPIMSCGDIIGEEHIADLGDAGLGIIDATYYTAQIDNAANKKFVADYLAKYNRKPAGHDYMGYLNMSLVLEALKATGGDTTPEKLRDALMNVKFDGPAGTVYLGPTRYANITVNIFEIAKKDSEYYYKILKTYPDVQPVDETKIPGLSQ